MGVAYARVVHAVTVLEQREAELFKELGDELVQGLEAHSVASSLFQGLLGGCEKNLDVDVFRHTIDEPMRLEQARAAGEEVMDTSVVTRQLAFSRVEVAEQVVMHLERAQSLEQLGDMDVFFGGLYGKAPQQSLRREVFKRLFLRVRNCSHTPPCGLPPLFF